MIQGVLLGLLLAVWLFCVGFAISALVLARYTSRSWFMPTTVLFGLLYVDAMLWVWP